MGSRGRALGEGPQYDHHRGALFSAGLYPQLKSHLALGKQHGITKEEVVAIVTQLAFYCGWPKAWSTFPLIEEVYGTQNND